MPKLAKRTIKLLAWAASMGRCFIRDGDWPPRLKKSVPALMKAGLLEQSEKDGQTRWRLTQTGAEQGIELLPSAHRWKWTEWVT